ncbi:hypothetical protein [Microbacterium suwonense]|uniref:hypothetical protein n=1 Tax=Microbacterium suwonense TaxID=683047 RepID=UPI003305C6F0
MHHYDRIDADLLWRTAAVSFPRLLALGQAERHGGRCSTEGRNQRGSDRQVRCTARGRNDKHGTLTPGYLISDFV